MAHDALSSEQQMILEQTTELVMQSGLGRRYTQALLRASQFAEMNRPSDYRSVLGDVADKKRRIIGAELPFVFTCDNYDERMDAWPLYIAKMNSESTDIVQYSWSLLGSAAVVPLLVHENLTSVTTAAYNPIRSSHYNENDIALASCRIAAQINAGFPLLNPRYGFPHILDSSQPKNEE